MSKPRPTRYSLGTINRAISLARRGYSRAVIERLTGMKAPTVAYHCARVGIVSPRTKQGHRTAFAPGARPFSQHDDAALLNLREKGFGYLKIAKILDRSRSSIRSRCLTIQAR